MGSERRNIIPLKLRVPRVDNIITLSSKLNTIGEEAFVRSYGEILNLLAVKVNVWDLVSLAQFYDPSLCCFTF